MICTIHIDDEVNCRVAGLRPEHNTLLWEEFGVFVEGYRYMPAFQLRRWDGKIRFYDKNGKTFLRLLPQIREKLRTWGYTENLQDSRVPAPKINIEITEDFFGVPHFKLRPYQVNVVNELLKHGDGIAVCATGAGKTSMCAALALIMKLSELQTIIIVPSSDLVTQTVAEFNEKLATYIEAGVVTIGEYSGSSKDIDHPIVVATWQALQNHPEYMKYFQAVIVDEAHGAKAQVIKDLINEHGRHISHRYGCTGTMPKPLADQMSLKTSIGLVRAEVRARWLIDNGYLSEIEIQPLETADIDPDLPDYPSEKAYLQNIPERSERIAREIMEMRDKHGNTMVLVNTQSLAQGREIAELIPGAVYLDGDSKKALRQEEYARYAEQDGIIIIASAGIASTGLSIDRIFCLVLLDTGKSFVKCIQSIGRGLRKKGDKNKVFVYDIYSKLKYAKKHWKDRLAFYKEAEYEHHKPEKLKYKC